MSGIATRTGTGTLSRRFSIPKILEKIKLRNCDTSGISMDRTVRRREMRMNVHLVEKLRTLTLGMERDELQAAFEMLGKELASRESSLEGASLGVRAARGGNQAEPSLRASTVMDDDSRLKWIFTYHDDPGKAPKYTAIRTAGRNFAEIILMHVDPCADRTLALRSVREAVIWANAALALDGVSF